MKRLELFFVLLVFGLVFSSGYAMAEEEEKTDSNVFTLGEVVVTGKSEIISQVATIETIDKEEMELNNANNVAEALDNVTGLSISKGSRNETYINVRGFSQRYVPVFYDGIPWYIPYDGYVDPGEISTGNISRVTLTKGASSSLYGANTMGGVINIVSLKPSEKFEGSLNLDLTKDQYVGSLNFGSMVGKFYFMGGLSGLDFNHFKMSDDYVPPAEDSPEDGGKRENSYKKSFTKSLKIGFMPTEGHEYAIGFHSTKSEKGLPPNIDSNERPKYWKFPEWEKSTYYIIGNTRITDNLSAKIRIFHDEYYNVLDSYDDETYSTQTRRYAFHSTYDDHTDGGSLVLRTDFIDNNILSFSYHIKDDVHQSQGDYDDRWEKYETRVSSYGVEDAISLNEKTSVVLGFNYDVQEATFADGNPLRDDDDSMNGVVGMTYGLSDDKVLHFSVAKKTRFPNQKELYSSYLDTSMPNPNLKKEQSVNYETGISTAAPFESNIAFTLFYSDVTDLITEILVYDEGEDDYLDFNDNIGRASLKGLEFTLNTMCFSRNNIQLSYSYINAENKSPDRSSDFLPEVPKHQLSITDKVMVSDRITLFGKVKYAKGQKEETRSYGWIELDDYWVFDVKGILHLSKNINFELSVLNAFDENYSTGYGFPQEGRKFLAGVKINF